MRDGLIVESSFGKVGGICFVDYDHGKALIDCGNLLYLVGEVLVVLRIERVVLRNENGKAIREALHCLFEHSGVIGVGGGV